MDKRATLAVIASLLLFGCSERSEEQGLANGGLSQFDVFITTEFLSSYLDRSFPFKLTRDVNSDSVTYTATFDLGSEQEDVHAYLAIKIAPAGSLFSDHDYRYEKDKFRQLVENLNAPDLFKSIPEEFFFPPLGARAIHGWGLGPNGGGNWCTFTTNDLKFDIRVDQGNHLDETTLFRACSVLDISAAILHDYGDTTTDND